MTSSYNTKGDQAAAEQETTWQILEGIAGETNCVKAEASYGRGYYLTTEALAGNTTYQVGRRILVTNDDTDILLITQTGNGVEIGRHEISGYGDADTVIRLGTVITEQLLAEFDRGDI